MNRMLEDNTLAGLAQIRMNKLSLAHQESLVAKEP
jgi:hypothetical protein